MARVSAVRPRRHDLMVGLGQLAEVKSERMEDEVNVDVSHSCHASTRPLPRPTRRCHSRLAHGGTLGAETLVGMRTGRPPQAEPIRARRVRS